MRKGDRVTAETGQKKFFLQESTEERTDSRAEETREKGNKEAGIESPLYKNRSVFFFSFELSKQQRQQWLCHKRFLILFNCKSNTHTHTVTNAYSHTHGVLRAERLSLFVFFLTSSCRPLRVQDPDWFCCWCCWLLLLLCLLVGFLIIQVKTETETRQTISWFGLRASSFYCLKTVDIYL